MKWWLAAAAGMVLGGGGSAQAFIITPIYDNPAVWTPMQMAVISQAALDWQSRVAFPNGNTQDFPIHFILSNVGTGGGAYLAQWQYDRQGTVQFPYSPAQTRYIYVNEDYFPQTYFGLEQPTAGAQKFDMLTVIRHEMGHAMGFAPLVWGSLSDDRWSTHIEGNIFDAGGLNVPLLADHAHLNVPGDLMYFSLGRDARREIGETDLQMLSLAYGYTIVAAPVPEPGTLGVLAMGSAALLWRRRRRGAAGSIGMGLELLSVREFGKGVAGIK